MFHLPVITMRWKLKLEGGAKELQTPPIATPTKSWEKTWLDVPVGEECVLLVELERSCLRGGVSESLLLY